MTQPPQGSPPGGSGYRPEPVYRDPRYAEQGQRPQGYIEPVSDGSQYLPPPYPPGQEPIPPRRPRRNTPILAPILAFLGLILIGGASLWAVSRLDGLLGESAAAEPTPAPVATKAPGKATPRVTARPGEVVVDTPEPEGPAPTAEPIVVTPPTADRADVKGTILFTRLGDIWAASGTTLTALTNSSSVKADSSPRWSPDGKYIYFIRTTKREVTDGQARFKGKYTLYPNDLMRMKPDGSARKKVYESLIKDGRGLWFSHVRQPSVSPNGANVAVVSDGNDGSADEVTLHIVNSDSGRMRKVGTPTEPAFGHNDPDFSPDGTKIAFTYNDNAGAETDPKIGIFTCRSKVNCTSGKVRYLKSGWANPSWSPDGSLLAVETTAEGGRDIAVVTNRGVERLRLTTGGDSFSPVFSPAGDQIAYLRRDGLAIDLRVMTLAFDDQGKITLVDDRAVTSDGQLDGESGLSWHIPKRQLTDRVTAPEPSPGVDASGESVEADATTEPANDASGEAPPPPPGS